MPVVAADQRKNNFDEVETEYSYEVISQEVKRCLECGYSYVDTTKCIGCGVCERVCPKGDVITLVKIEDGGEQ
jgi:ferredoxin